MATTTQPGESAQDRRRAREDRGVQSTSAASADRLPSPPRERRPALAALAVLLIVGGAAVAGLLAIRADTRVPVLRAGTTIGAGTEITEGHLTTTRVASEGTQLIPESQLDQLVGRYARVTINEGQLIDTTMVASDGMLASPESVALGAALAPGRLPASGLQSGDVVDLIDIGDGTGEVLVTDARVGRVERSGDGGGTVGGTGSATVTLFVAREDAPEVSAVAAAGELSVVLIERGTPIQGD